MLKRNLRRALGAAAVTTALILGSAAAAHANPAPDNGPVAGGTTVTVPEPAGITFTQMSSGFSHRVALGSDGNAYAWGEGYLGDGTITGSEIPVLVDTSGLGGVTFTQVSVGTSFALAIGSDGNIYSWGQNTFGQLGDGTTTSRLTPVLVDTSGLGGITFTQVSASTYHSAALGSDGNVYAWGFNISGLLGVGGNANQLVPALVNTSGIGNVAFTQISTGTTTTLGIGVDGNTYAWGVNNLGQLGDGTTTSRSTPVLVDTSGIGGVAFTQIDTGDFHSVAIGANGNTYAWGLNSSGQLGDGTATNRSTPVLVDTSGIGGIPFMQISAGNSHSVAIGSDGHAYAWGSGDYGELGDGMATASSTPVRAGSSTDIFSSITASLWRSLALDSAGNIYVWGSDHSGLSAITAPVLFAPIVAVTGVTFDGLAGTNLVDNGDGTWSVDTPAHAAGSVDVVVSWTLNGVAQTPVTYSDGYTYNPPPVAPTITDPADQTVAMGDTATFAVTPGGTPTPTVVWEVSRDGGTTWEPITADPAATPSGDGQTLSVVGTVTNDDSLYRATATNSEGSVTSQAAKLTVTKPAGNGGDDPKKDDEVNKRLSNTGMEFTSLFWIAGLVALLLGGGLIAGNRVINRRMKS